MANNFFEEEPYNDMMDDGSYVEVPAQQLNRAQNAPTQSAPSNIENNAEMIIKELADDELEEEDYSQVLADAEIRLELGKLYKMLMDHDLFSGSSNDDQAVRIITKEIRNFAKKQMEIMLGMRQEKKVQEVVVETPFNDLEIQTLKALAKAATKGATERLNQQQEAKKSVTSINKLSTSSNSGSLNVKKESPSLQKRPSQPIQRAAKPAPAPQQAQGSQPTVPTDKEKQLREKSWDELTDSEKIERNNLIKNRRAIPQNHVPQPTYEQLEMHYATQVNQLNSNPAAAVLMSAVTKR